MFGFKIIRKSEYEELRNYRMKFLKMVKCHRWFSGWKDLDILWNYILKDINFGGIERARRDYATARGTDEYGRTPNE